jgi:Tfp pilus assembly protein PilF
MRRNRKGWQWIAGCGALALFVVAACTKGSQEEKKGEVIATGYLNHGPDAEYVGRQACQPCHADKYESFIASEMGRSFKPAKTSLSSADFHNAHPVHDKQLDLWYFPFTQGEEMFVREFRLEGKDTVFSRTEKIDFIVGSGQHTNSHIFEENGYLHQMPLTYYTQEGKWDLPPGYENGSNSRFSRAIEIECMTCHNAMPKYVAGTDNRYDAIPDGVDCERCHGPGSIHVKTMQAGGDNPHFRDGIDYTIVHPGKLPVDLQFDICQRCHLQGTAVPVEGKTFMDFRPGMKLGDVINVFLPRWEDSLQNFIMASHPDRLRMSKCFAGSQSESGTRRPMTCITCHNPHESIKAKGLEAYKLVCEGCHQQQKCTAPEASLKAEQYLCTKCHMPPSGSADIPHVRITDHFIRIPEKQISPSDAAAQKRFLRLACLTQTKPSPRVMAEGYLAYHEQFSRLPAALDSADTWLRRALATESEEALLRPLVRLRYLQGDNAALAALASKRKPASVPDSWTAYRLGEGLLAQGQPSAAQDWMGHAVRLSPQHLKFRARFGEMLLAQGQPAQALAQLDTLLQLYPKAEGAWNNRGFAKVQTGQVPASESDFVQELKLQPAHEMALANLASVYFNTGRAAQAKVLVIQLRKIRPNHPPYENMWKLLGGS